MSPGTVFLLILAGLYVVFGVYGMILAAFDPNARKQIKAKLDEEYANRTEMKTLMNTRVSQNGIRFGAMVDAVNSRANGRKPTDWR